MTAVVEVAVLAQVASVLAKQQRECAGGYEDTGSGLGNGGGDGRTQYNETLCNH